MESTQELPGHQLSTRDCSTISGVLGTPTGMESVCLGGGHLEELGAARTKTVRTRGLFNYMDLPAEIRVHVGTPGLSVLQTLAELRALHYL